MAISDLTTPYKSAQAITLNLESKKKTNQTKTPNKTTYEKKPYPKTKTTKKRQKKQSVPSKNPPHWAKFFIYGWTQWSTLSNLNSSMILVSNNKDDM